MNSIATMRLVFLFVSPRNCSANLSAMSITQNLGAVLERIEAAALRAGRTPSEITLMAVSKTFPARDIREAYDAGQRLFGENRVQEFAEKAADSRALAGAEFHLIGHLQSNKSARAVELFDAIDSVDSLRLAERLNDAAAKSGKRLPILIEINVGGEQQKAGIAPRSNALEELLQAAPRLEHLQIRGLMTIPPFAEDPEQSRPFFRVLRELRDVLAQRHLPRVELGVLSMGMSHDYEVAVEEGSTCVRIGSAIFGEREKSQ
jgi:pyridoxal phosphate enzyme (YggS family)